MNTATRAQDQRAASPDHVENQFGPGGDASPQFRNPLSIMWAYLTDPTRRARYLPSFAASCVAVDGLIMAGSPWQAAGAAIAAGAALAAFNLRKIRGKAGWAYTGGALAYTSVWAHQIASHGAVSWAGVTDALLLAGGAALAAPYVYRYRWTYDPIEELDLPPVEDLTDFQQVFRDYVAIPGSNRASWVLTNEWEVPNGYQADVVVPRGEAATEDILAAGKYFRSGYDLGPTRVILEETPDRRSTRARLTVLEKDVLAEPRVWAGPTLDTSTGLAIIGNYPDGALAHMQYFAPGSGTVDTIVAGTKGSGKSRFLDKNAAEVHLCPVGVLWVNDPQEGQSLSDWIDAAANYALGGDEYGYEACLKQLRALRRIVIRRSAYLAREIEWVDKHGRERKGGKTFFDPSVEMPFLYDLLDEVHMLVKNPDPDVAKEALKLISDIAKLSRKTGIGVAYVVHSPSQDEMGGAGAAVLRSMLREGNVVAFRTAEAVANHMLGIKADPSKLPAYFADGRKTQGLGLLKGPDGRDAPFRAEYVEDAYGIAQLPAAGQLDAMSLEAAAAPDDPDRAPKTFNLPDFTLPRPAIPVVPTAAEKQNWADRVLQVFSDGGQRSLGAVIKAFPGDASDRSIRWGLKKLVADGLLETDGPKKPYRITAAGRAELERRTVAA